MQEQERILIETTDGTFYTVVPYSEPQAYVQAPGINITVPVADLTEDIKERCICTYPLNYLLIGGGPVKDLESVVQIIYSVGKKIVDATSDEVMEWAKIVEERGY